MTNNKPTWWQMMKIKLMMGHPFAPVQDLTNYKRTVIRFKDKFIEIAEGPNDEMEFGWSRNIDMFPESLHEMWIANPPRGKNDKG